MTVRIQLVLLNLPAQRVAVDTEQLRRFRLVALGAVQYTLNEPLFEFLDSFFEKDSPLHHLVDEPFQLIFHDGTLRWMFVARGPVVTAVRGWSKCGTPPGIFLEWRLPPREAAPARAGFWASASVRDSPAQTVCQKRPAVRLGCNAQRARSATNPASALRQSKSIHRLRGQTRISCPLR